MLYWLTLFVSLTCFANCANILGFFPLPSISHQVVYQPIWRELSLRGHKVTVLTTNPLKDPKLKNLTEIDLSFAYDIIKRRDVANSMAKDNYLITNVLFAMDMGGEFIENEIMHPDVQNLINDKTKTFDLIIVECLQPLVYAIAARFKAPVIGMSSLGVFLHSHDAVGNPTHPVLTPDLLLNVVGEMSLIDKAYSAFYNVWYRLLYYWYILPKNDKIARKYFGEDMPFLGDIERNTSLLLLNTNPILHPIRPNLPAVIELGQMHINKKKPLPNDLQSYLDKSTQGVIYFSLGSNVKSANLTDNVREIIVQALSELPYNVLWKWETDYLPNKPKNVITKKWLPQQDVLGHKNIKAFVTQGGLQSMEEAITNGVPLIGMPFFADQPLNVFKMVKMGIAAGPVDYTTMTKDSLKAVIMDVAKNDKYRKKVKELRDLLCDQPMTGLEKATWWIEYVIRHKGARHLRSPLADMPWYQYYLLDVYIFIGFIIALVISIPAYIIRH